MRRRRLTITDGVERLPIPNAEGGDLLKGLVAGVAGGVAGAWAMNQFHALISRLGPSQEDDVQQEAQKEPGDAQAAQRGRQPPHGEPATVLAAETVSEGLLHHELTRKERRYAGPVMHYGFGATVGGIYGVTREAWPVVDAGRGAGYGTLVWLGADEMAVPAFGLAPPPTQQPPSMHLSALGAHIVFGTITEAVRRLVRQLL